MIHFTNKNDFYVQKMSRGKMLVKLALQKIEAMKRTEFEEIPGKIITITGIEIIPEVDGTTTLIFPADCNVFKNSIETDGKQESNNIDQKSK